MIVIFLDFFNMLGFVVVTSSGFNNIWGFVVVTSSGFYNILGFSASSRWRS